MLVINNKYYGYGLEKNLVLSVMSKQRYLKPNKYVWFLMMLNTAPMFLLALVGYCAVSSLCYSQQNVDVGRRNGFYPQVRKSDASTHVWSCWTATCVINVYERSTNVLTRKIHHYARDKGFCLLRAFLHGIFPNDLTESIKILNQGFQNSKWKSITGLLEYYAKPT